jgi:hypothetical protein
MARGDKYHPLDVRYKGPSTAYRGSAYGKPKRRLAPKTAPQSTSIAGPWGANKAGASKAHTTKPVTQPPAHPKKQSSGFGRVIFWGIALIIIADILFG